jgi:general secretion pathway protein G
MKNKTLEGGRHACADFWLAVAKRRGWVSPHLPALSTQSEDKVAHAQIESLGSALDQYRLDVGHYPSTEQGLAALMAKPANEPTWNGPYLKKAVPTDPWSPLHLPYPRRAREYDLYTYGKDG